MGECSENPYWKHNATGWCEEAELSHMAIMEGEVKAMKIEFKKLQEEEKWEMGPKEGGRGRRGGGG